MNLIAESAASFRYGNQDQALRLLAQLRNQTPTSVEALLNTGTILGWQGKLTQAEGSFKQAIEADPFDFRPYYNLFVIEWRAGNKHAAMESLQQCTSLLFTIKANQTQGEQSLQSIEQALKLWPHNTAAWALKCLYHLNANKLQQASEVASEALEVCEMKHHLYAIRCIVDSRLNRETERERNARNYHSHLLRPVQYSKKQPQVNEEFQQQQLQQVISKFNQLQDELQLAQCCEYSTRPNVYFTKGKKRTSVDVSGLISKNLGMLDLVCIKEEDNNNEEVQSQQVQAQEVERVDQGIIEQAPSKQEKIDLPPRNSEGVQKQVIEPAAGKSLKSSPEKPSSQSGLLYPITHPNFQIKLLLADLKISQELIGKMDPYVYYEYGQQKHKSTIAKKQGTKPRWQNEIQIFALERNPTKMKISVYDKEMFKWDDLVGAAEFEVVKLGLHEIQLFLEGRNTGMVVFEVSKRT